MILKNDIQQKCMRDNELFYHLCKAMDVVPQNGLVILRENRSVRLRTIDVLNVIETHTGLQQSEILVNPLKTAQA